MTHHRIVVGVDGSAAAQSALQWALRQASWLNATVLVVTAWQEEGEPEENVDDRGEYGAASRPHRLRDRFRSLTELQQRCIADARDSVAASERPVVGRVLMRADPVSALRNAARRADLVVVGCSDRPLPTSVGAALVKSGTALVLVSAPQLVIAPSEAAVAAAV
jgi:nucleotide-binding universal stress UspA family protein